MAKTKQDYIEQGRADGSVGASRKSGFTKNSWQENAYDLGYNEAYKQYLSQGLRMAADAETDRLVKSDFMPYAPRALPVYDLPTAVTEHIRRLNEDAAACPDPRRKARLYNKANRLNNKWLEKASA